MSKEVTSDRTEDFSLVLGGPVYQFLLRVGLIKPPLHRVAWRMLIISMAAWLPLFVLALLDGRLLGGAKVPFLYDFEVQVRLLASLPLLIAAEVIIHQRVRVIVREFRERRIVTGALEKRFEEIIESAQRLRNSAPIELGLLVCVLFAGAFFWSQVVGLQSDTWYATLGASGKVTTPAGYWYQFVSVPISQFILLRWYFRLFVWWRFLWQVSKVDLNLVPIHPDGSCGLGFLRGIVFAMAPFLLAHSCVLAGYIANRILHEGAKLPDYYTEMGALALTLYLIAVGPLCVFTPRLLGAKRLGLLVYGRFASEYVIGFDRKWIGGQRPPDEPLMGTGDIQSLSDLANGFAVVKAISPFPFGKESLVGLAVIIALPLLPLSLTMFSFQELVMRLMKIVL